MPATTEEKRTTILNYLGMPYIWGAGNLANADLDKAEGVDCSGLVQGLLVKLQHVSRLAWYDKTAHDLAYVCEPVPLDEKRLLGDLVFYGRGTLSHVTMLIDDKMCVGANGGGRKTDGTDPKACVQARPFQYRSDFVTIGRVKPRYQTREYTEWIKKQLS